MTTTSPSPWAPQSQDSPSPSGDVPTLPPPPAPRGDEPPAGRRRLSGKALALAAAVLIVAVVAATAAITYALTSRTADTNPAVAVPEPTTEPAPAAGPTAAQTAAAKEALCTAFGDTVKGTAGRGGVIQDGELNIPLVVRKLGSVVAVQNAITANVPEEFAALAKTYVDTTLRLANAALASESLEYVNDLNNEGNAAIERLFSKCGFG